MAEADVAKALRCSTGTVKSQTSRGLARLREVLDDEGPAQGPVDLPSPVHERTIT
jgi:DNA-directed RNA polymerase specialized sigma24 family protein